MIKNNSAIIYTFFYKANSVIVENELYKPIMCGKALINYNGTIAGDDLFDNISEKNQYYSELTGIYWIWKNTKQEITGTCHYRRYFTAKPVPKLYMIKRFLYFISGLYKKRFGLIYTVNTKLFTPKILNAEELKELFRKYDAILPQARKMKYTVETHYRRYHDIKDLDLIRTILIEKYPEYIEAFDSVLQGKRLYANNMFVMKDIYYQEFMKWWFDILFEFERRIKLSNYTGYQKRIVGFMAERLLNVWFQNKKLNCAELPVIYFKHLKFEGI